MGDEGRESAAPEARGGIDRPRLYAEIETLASRASGRARFLRQSLRAVARGMGAVHATLYVRIDGDVIEEEFTAEGSDPSFWKPALEGILTSAMREGGPAGRLFRAREADLLVSALAANLRSAAGGNPGAVAVVVPCSGVEEAQAQQSALESCAHLIALLLQRFERREARLDAQAEMKAAVDLGRVATFSSPRELAFAITNNLRNVTSTDQIALGFAQGARVEVLSLSGYDEVKAQSEGVRALTGAMEECLDAGAPIVWQRESGLEGDAAPSDWKLHRRWSEATGGSAVASFPVGPVNGTTAIVSVRRQSGRFSEEEIGNMRRLVEPYLGAFGLVGRASRSLPEHVRDSMWSGIGWLRAPGENLRRAGAVLGAAAFLWLCFGPMPFTVSTRITVVPAEVQQLGAPFEGALESSKAVAGDAVRKGDVLATFRTSELQLERDRLGAELQVQKYAAGEAMARGGTPVEVRLAQAQGNLLETQIALLDQRIAAASIRAPFDGVVVSGDLRARIGQSFSLGEPLFQVAPDGRWRLRLQVPEQAVDDITAGQTGTFATEARPDESEPFEVRFVSPSAEVVGGRNVYVAEADVEIAAPWMRPGMEGVGKIHAGHRVTWWVLLHRVTDWLRLNFWL